MRPVCVPCRTTMHPEENGFEVVVMKPEPYQVWQGDKWKCGGCGIEVVTGFGTRAISTNHEPDFANHMRREPLEITDG